MVFAGLGCCVAQHGSGAGWPLFRCLFYLAARAGIHARAPPVPNREDICRPKPDQQIGLWLCLAWCVGACLFQYFYLAKHLAIAELFALLVPIPSIR